MKNLQFKLPDIENVEVLSRDEMKSLKGGAGDPQFQCYKGHDPNWCDAVLSKIMAYYQQQQAQAMATYTQWVNGLSNTTCFTQVDNWLNGTGNYPYSC